MRDASLALSALLSVMTTAVATLLAGAADGPAWVIPLVFAVSLFLFFFIQRLRVWRRRRGLLSEEQREGQNYLFVGCSVLLAAAMLWELIGPIWSHVLVADADVHLMVHSHRWISYDPLDFDPYSRLDPSPTSMKKELASIAASGFDGVITFGSLGTRSVIPELAKDLGLAVIMGVWDPGDPREIRVAMSKRDYVDAYCVGHNGLDTLYSYRQLVNAVNLIRLRTLRPVSTTERLGLYKPGARIVEVGDWLFPDAHVEVRDRDRTKFLADAARDAEVTINRAKEVAKLARESDRPLLLKMITYPMDGISNASLQQQLDYYVLMLETRRDVLPEMPQDVAISVHSAFDAPWKARPEFKEWDPFTGLLDEYGNPRPAAVEIVGRLP